VQCLLLRLRLVHLFIVEHKLAIRVRVAVAVGCGQVCGIQDIHTQGSLVIERLAGIEAHLDWKVLQANRDLVVTAMLVFQNELCRSVQAPPQRIKCTSRKLGNNMIVVTVAIFVQMLDDAECDL
jgi:hypothetical protein